MSQKSRILALLVATVLVALGPTAVCAQAPDGSTSQTLVAGGLGAFSGATLGGIGGLLPCNRRVDGRRCVVSSASVGGALGLAMGGLIGSENTDALRTRARGAGYGLAGGAVVGLLLRSTVHEYDWYDVGTMAAVGGAIGAVPHGAALGAGAGTVVGALVWVVKPEGSFQDLVMFTLAGIAVGGMADWLDGASDATRSGYTISFSLGT